jgi:hypothetical protein
MKRLGINTYVLTVRGDRRNGQQAVCVRIDGIPYNGNPCELCAILN